MIGDAACSEIVEEIGKEYREFAIRSFLFHTLEETVSVILANDSAMDMWLIMEPCAYLHAKEWGGAKKPLFHIPYRGASLFKTLCQIFYNERYSVNDISFDTVTRNDIKRGFEEMNILYGDTIFVSEFSRGMSVEQTFQYHYDLWQSGKTKVAVTCIEKVSDLLAEAGVPVFRVLPVRLSVRSMFYNMLNRFDLQIVKDAQIAVLVFEFDILLNNETVYSTDDLYNEELKLTQKLIAYAKKTQASLKAIGQGKYFLFTTRGQISSITNNFVVTPSIEEFVAVEKNLVACGIGIGLSAYEAEFNATTALRNAKQYEKGSWMIIFDDKTITGPLGKKEQLTYTQFSEDMKVISSTTSISIATLSKITGILAKKGTDQISAQDLAQYMNILPRSARRILAKLEEYGIAVAVGDENPNLRGRPRKLYRIKIGQV